MQELGDKGPPAGAVEMHRRTRERKQDREHGEGEDLVARSKERHEEPHPVTCAVTRGQMWAVLGWWAWRGLVESLPADRSRQSLAPPAFPSGAEMIGVTEKRGDLSLLTQSSQKQNSRGPRQAVEVSELS